jgi:gliding motility-associated-like protein
MKTTIFKTFLFLFLNLIAIRAFAQPTTFRLSYDVGAFDISGGMVENPAGEFVFAGLNNSFGPYYGDIVKVNNAGTVIWAKTYTGGFATNFSDIKNVSTGGYIITGSSTSGGGGAILIRVDNLGAVIWAKRYQLPDKPTGNASNEYGSSVIETSDGGFLVGGGVDYFWDGVSATTVDTTSALAFKVNSAGTLLWNKVWTITNPTKPDEHFINDVAESADGYFFVGESADETQAYNSNGDLPRNALIIKTDKAAGTLTYIRRWGAGNTTSQGINSALKLSTGNILLGGYDDLNGFLVSISGIGAATPSVIFNRRLNGSAFGNTYLLQDIMENADGNYSVIGTQLAFLSVAFNTMIVKLNSGTGALMFGRSYAPIGLSAILPEGGLCADQGYNIIMTDQQMTGFNHNLIRTDATGQLGAGAAGCASNNLTPALGAETVTFSTPVTAIYNSLVESPFAPVVNNIVPTLITHCLNVACTPPTPSVAGSNQSVCGTSATLAGNTPVTGTGLWTLVSGSGTITTPTSPTSGVTGLGAGANVFMWTISNAPCTASSSNVTITSATTPTASNAGPNQTVCATTATFAGNTPVSGTGAWTLVSGTGTITTPSSPSSGITGLGIGANVFQWTISNAPCASSSSTVTITGSAATTVAAAGANQSICGTTATLAGNAASVGTGSWSLVSGSGTITTPTSPTSGVTALGVGPNVFMWTISNPPCASTTSNVTITGVAPPTTSAAGPNQTVCGTTATLAGNAATVGTGLWTLVSGAGTITTPSSPTSGITALGVGPNVFQWTISSSPCTSSTSTVTITGVTAPTVSAAGSNQTVCGTTATLVGNTPATGTGLWTLVSGAGTITTPSSPTSGITALGVGANVFQWTISNAGCPSSSSSVTITGVAAPTVSSAGPNQTVCGTTATLAGNTPTTGTGLWTLVSGAGTITTPSSPTSGITALGVGANVFQWTISNAPCPASTSSVTISGAAAPTVAAAGSNQTICGTTATLAGNTATTGTGAWSLVSGAGTITTPSSPTSGITSLGVGTNVFMWTISNAPCPASTSTVTITGVATPTVANAGPNQTLCSTSATLAGNTATVGTGTWTLVSGAGTVTTPSSPTSTVTGLGLGANVFQWTIVNPPCPSTSSSVTITSTGGATTAAAGPDQTVCGTTATLAGNTPAVGTGAWTLVSGAGTITTPTSPTSGITGLGVGANVFMWTISSAPCPPSTSTVTITGLVAPTVAAAGANQSLCNTFTTLAGNTPLIGTGTWTLVSGTGTITTPSSPTSGVTGLGLGANVFMWTISNAPCPSSTSTVTITNTGGPTVTITSQTNVNCNATSTGSAAVSATGGIGSLTYSWTGGAGSSSSAAGLAAGTYVVTVTDSAGCAATASVTITQPTAITASVSATTTTCGASTGTATVTTSGGTGSYTYNWTPGTPTGDGTNAITNLAVGSYNVTITDSLGCIQSATGSVGSVGGSAVDAGTDVTITAGGNAVLNGTAGVGATYSWSPSGSLSCSNCQNPVASPTVTTTYTLTVTLGGCSSSDTVTVFVDIKCGEIFVPNVFSPNGDNENDTLKIYGNCITNLEFVIYDRWGEKVFETDDPNKGWDGTVRGKKMDAAVFVYYLNATVVGVEVKKHGNITLVK